MFAIGLLFDCYLPLEVLTLLEARADLYSGVLETAVHSRASHGVVVKLLQLGGTPSDKALTAALEHGHPTYEVPHQ